MKKITLILLCIIQCVLCIQVSAQQLKQIQDNCQFYVVSPNANCFAGAPDGGPANFYRFSDDYFYQSQGHYASFITDKGEIAASFNTDAAIWTLGTDDYRTFPTAEGNIKGRIMGFSKDFSSLLVSNRGYYVYELHEDKFYHPTQIFLPQKDSIYHLAPQHVQIKGFSSDGRRIAGRFMNSDGQRETPFVIEKNAEGEWVTRFVAVGNLLYEGCEMPERPVREGDGDPTYNERLMEYYEVRAAMETGIYYELSNMSMSENGKYLAVNVPMMIDGVEAYQMTYAGVIDIDADTLYIFKSIPDAACPAVSNYGEASICTPALAYLRQTYIGSINDIDNPQPLVDWAKKKTKGQLDLTEVMTFTSNAFGDKSVIAGSALISAEGNGFVSYLFDEWDSSDIYNFLVCFDSPLGTSIQQPTQLFFYQHNDVLYFDTQLTDIKIYTLAGQLLLQTSESQSHVNISSLNSGIYILTAITNNQPISHKLRIGN